MTQQQPNSTDNDPTTALDTVDIEKRLAIEALLRCGVPVNQISTTLGVSDRLVKSLATFREVTSFSTRLNPGDAALADGMRQLAWAAWREAMLTLRTGSPGDRAMLTRAIVGRSMALIGAEKAGELDTVREEFQAMVGDMRSSDSDDYLIDLPAELTDD